MFALSLSAPEVLGRTPAEKLGNALRRVLRVPKDVILREEAKEKRKRERKERTEKSALAASAVLRHFQSHFCSTIVRVHDLLVDGDF